MSLAVRSTFRYCPRATEVIHGRREEREEAVGRPSRPFPEPIDMTPEGLAEKVLSMPMKKYWRYLKKDK